MPVERQRLEVGHVRVEQYEGYASLVQGVGKLPCSVELRRHYYYSVGLLLKALLRDFGKRFEVEPLVVHHLDFDVEVAPVVACAHGALLNLVPVCLGLVFGYDAVEVVTLVACQRACVHVGVVVHFLQGFFHFFPRCLRYIGPVVEHSVDCADRNARQFGYILYPNLFWNHVHNLSFMLRQKYQ